MSVHLEVVVEESFQARRSSSHIAENSPVGLKVHI